MELVISLLVKIEIYAIFLMALNSLMLGKLNLMAIGNIVYFSVGAFTTGFLVNALQLKNTELYIVFLLVPILCCFLSLLFLRISNVLKNDFFLFFSLFIIELAFVINNQMAGPSGYSHILRPIGLQSDLSILMVLTILLFILILWLNNLNKSRVNKLFTVIRSSDILAQATGIDINKNWKPIFIASSIISGIAGVFFAFYSYGADPHIFSTNEIITLFVLIIFTGIDSIRSSITAALIYVLFIYLLDSILDNKFQILAPKLSQICYGLILIVFPILLPNGLFGKRPL